MRHTVSLSEIRHHPFLWAFAVTGIVLGLLHVLLYMGKIYALGRFETANQIYIERMIKSAERQVRAQSNPPNEDGWVCVTWSEEDASNARLEFQAIRDYEQTAFAARRAELRSPFSDEASILTFNASIEEAVGFRMEYEGLFVQGGNAGTVECFPQVQIFELEPGPERLPPEEPLLHGEPT